MPNTNPPQSESSQTSSSNKSPDKKVALITGCSTGLGISLAIQLAKKHYQVFATMRSLEKKQELENAADEANVDIAIMQLDVSKVASIEQCVANILERTGKIDLLINNAGAGFVRTTEQATEAEIHWIMDVNFHGVVRCTKAVLPHMRAARSGHIVNISSVGGLVGQPFNEIYCAAKFAVEGYTESLAGYVTPAFDVHFTSVQPGGIVSEFSNSVLAHMQSTGGMLEDEYKPLLEKYIGGAQRRAAEGENGVYQTGDEVAQVIIEQALIANPPVRIRTSEWSEEFTHLKTIGDPQGKKLQLAMQELVS